LLACLAAVPVFAWGQKKDSPPPKPSAPAPHASAPAPHASAPSHSNAPAAHTSTPGHTTPPGHTNTTAGHTTTPGHTAAATGKTGTGTAGKTVGKPAAGTAGKTGTATTGKSGAGGKTGNTAMSKTAASRTPPGRQVSLRGGGQAHIRPNGQIRSVNRNGMHIEHGMHGGRTVVSSRNGVRVVSVGRRGGYVQRAYVVRGGRSYYSRTYYYHGAY